ncbi:Uncharacterized conserved protein, conains N-terminal glutamine amidotransferase (GATase1)-like domain [Prosthecobacter debontii]|uniref:Uncharacterized conserved protein, conains N-terminal glutamine amidotransferase (GATase1)-like domain n=1 Tax=Prosthecobacter debontii TaxID=48467 RepID=A0A1T4YVA0_9BACT|nr:Uncharacterized conserved protein, conains N-terminal glutamine amidotransferase (GATase1)-like domain [Prosthecobacter debontii]
MYSPFSKFITRSSLPLIASEGLADGVRYPQAEGTWLKAEGLKNEGLSHTIELTPGHFYQVHPIPGKKSTGIYHSTSSTSLNLTNPKINTAALNLVAEFPIQEARWVQENSQWYLIGRKETDGPTLKLRLSWNELTTIPPRPPVKDHIRVALFDDYGSFGKGVPRCSELLKAQTHMEVTLVKPALIRQGGLKDYDVVIFTGGSGGKQAGTLGLVGREQVRRFVESGGGYIGICAGNYLACDGFSWGVKILDAKTKSSKWARGVGDVKIEFTPQGREILGMPEGLMDVRYANGPVFTTAENDVIPDFEPLAYFRTELAENGSPKGAQINSPAMIIGHYGQGRVLCSSPHPEQQPGMESFIVRAVEWTVGQR